MTSRLKVVALALLGYGYLASILGWLAWQVPSSFWDGYVGGQGGRAYQWALTAGMMVLVLVQAIFKVRVPTPEGAALAPEDAPRLFACLAELRGAMRSPEIHHVLLTEEFNASVRQVPRWGPFGRPTNYLLLGLPLLEALSPEQLRAALVHEFGHLSGSHGRLGAWIYRLRSTWSRISQAADGSEAQSVNWLSRMVFRWGIRTFFRWYAPLFRARSLALSRLQELEADRLAAGLAGRDHLAACLLRCEIAGRYLEEEFWPALGRLVLEAPEPPIDVFVRLRAALADPAALKTRAAAWLEEALAGPGDEEDTHPPLSERLSALGCAKPAIDAALPPAACAAEAFLGEAADRLRGALGERWAKRRQDAWRRRHLSALSDLARAQGLQRKEAEGILEKEDAWTLYRDSKALWGPTQAAPVLEDMLKRWPDHPQATFEAGTFLLAQGEASGAALLERASSIDPHLTPAACSRLNRFLERRGRPRDETLRLRLRGYERELDKAEAERWSARAAWRKHDIEEARLRRLRALLASLPEVRLAYVVRKEAATFPDQPFYLLVIVLASVFRAEAADAALLERVMPTMAFPGEARVLRLREFLLRTRLWLLGPAVYQRPRDRMERALLALWGLLGLFLLSIAVSVIFSVTGG